MTSYAHWPVPVFAYSDTYQNIYLFIPFKSLRELFFYKSLVEIFQQAKNKFNSSILTHHNPIISRIARNLVLEQQWAYPVFMFIWTANLTVCWILVYFCRISCWRIKRTYIRNYLDDKIEEKKSGGIWILVCLSR